MAYSPNFCTDGTASASQIYNESYAAAFAFDQNPVHYWDGYPSSYPGAWIKYDLGVGAQKIAAQYTIEIESINYPTEWIFQGSNDDTNWDDLDHPESQAFSPDEKRTFNSFSNTTAYRYYRLYFVAYTSVEPAIQEIEMMELCEGIDVDLSELHQFDIGGSEWAEVWGTFGKYGTTPYGFVLTYDALAVPAGSKIVEAIAYFKCGSEYGYSSDVCSVNCYFNDADDAIHPGDNAGAEDLELTSAVAWSAIEDWQGYQNDIPSPDLAAALQEVIDRPGWESGNQVQLVVRDNGSDSGAYRQTRQFSAGQIHLTVKYQEEYVPPPPPPACFLHARRDRMNTGGVSIQNRFT